VRHDTAIPLLRQRPVSTAAGPLSTIDPGTGSPVRSLYIHIPFCFHKCHYCDFYSLADTRDRQPIFADRLTRELAALAPWARAPLRTIFAGGGTPSLLRIDLWRRLLEDLHRLFDLSDPGLEFTVECNPETITRELMDVLAAGRVNRVSIGAQSFDLRHLKTLERWHDPDNVERAIALSRAAGIPRQSVDLIFGIPGQTLGEWEADLRRALALGTTHVSCYDLTYEPNTAMTTRLKRGEFEPAPEDLEVEMYEATLRLTRAAGLARYEVSNYATPGDECRHNLAYWRQEQWLAAGPSASGHVAGHRWKNAPRLDDYLTTDDGGFAPISDHEPPDPARALRERIMTGLRLAEGLDTGAILADLETRSPPHPLTPSPAHSPSARVLRLIEVHTRRGHLTSTSGRWRLTDTGFLLADGIAADLMAAIGN
jgi:oxygen-independent coproporphyrinogen III oxidase